MKTMTVAMLRQALAGVDDRLEVIIRCQDDDNCTVGGLVTATVDSGCSEVDAFVLDGMADAEETTKRRTRRGGRR